MEETLETQPVTKTPLSRKALVLGGAAVGFIITGALIFLKGKDQPEELMVVEDSDESDDLS